MPNRPKDYTGITAISAILAAENRYSQIEAVTEGRILEADNPDLISILAEEMTAGCNTST
jgi:hypothetical protein